MKIEQEVGGSATNQDAYTGPERQLTVDTDNWDLRLHDGVTPGGRRILSRDNADQRYQAKSIELGGFNFSSELRGFVTRLAPGNYKIRKFQVNTAQLGITNPDGYADNPTLSLNATITTAHTFSNNITVEGTFTATGGIVGDVTGNLNGNVVGNVVGNVTGNVTGNANGNHIGSFTGAVDVRGSTILFDNNQIPTDAIAGLEAFVQLNAVPAGIIMLWSGLEASIPAGWALCNGLNGTPDLRDKFVIGAGSLTYPPATVGGASTHNHTITVDDAGDHTHSLTIAGHVLTLPEIPSHSHGNGCGDVAGAIFGYGTKSIPATAASVDDNGANGVLQGNTESVGGGGPHGHAGSTAANAGTHTHSANNSSASNLPPYYALCYIMRVIV